MIFFFHHKFFAWLESWEISGLPGLPKLLFQVAIQTSATTILLVQYILDHSPNLDYVLHGNKQNGFLEAESYNTKQE